MSSYKPGSLRPINPRIYVCYYCGLNHPDVEAGGVFCCPNPCCLGPGQAHGRSKLESYREVAGGRHTVDLDELFDVGLRKAIQCGNSAIATQAFISCVRYCIEGTGWNSQNTKERL